MKTKRKPKITFTKTKAGAQKGEWRYTIKAPNGEKLVTSEGYTSRRDVARGLNTLYQVILSAELDRILNENQRRLFGLP